MVGAIVTALLFMLGKFGITYYIGSSNIGSTYGAAGSLVILLVWVYWSAQILFLGAEFTQVYARTYGSLEGDTSKRDARAQAARSEDRPRAETTPSGRPIGVRIPAPAYAAKTAAPKRGGRGLLKIAAGGFVGLLFGAILGGISATLMLLKSLKKVIVPFR